MKPLGDERTHYLLAMGMAKATRTDLAGAMEEGALSPAGWAGMITRCRGCDWADGCADWLDGNLNTAPPQGAACPPRCTNQRRFAELRRRSAEARAAADAAVEASTRAMARADRQPRKAAS